MDFPMKSGDFPMEFPSTGPWDFAVGGALGIALGVGLGLAPALAAIFVANGGDAGEVVEMLDRMDGDIGFHKYMVDIYG